MSCPKAMVDEQRILNSCYAAVILLQYTSSQSLGSMGLKSKVQSLDQGQALLRSGAVSPFSTMHLLRVL